MTQDLLAYSDQVISSDNLRPIGSRSPIRRGRLHNNKRRYLKRDVCVPTLQKIWQIELICIPSVPESLKSGADGHSDKKETPPKGCLHNMYIITRRISAASSASARCSQNIEAAGTPSPILLPQAAALQKPNGLFADRLRP